MVGVDGPVRGGDPSVRLEHCLRAAAEQGGASLRARVRVALGELLRFAAADPEAARALLAGGRGGGEAAGAQREKLMERLVACLEQTVARYPPPGPPPSPLAAAAIVGGVERILRARLHADEQGDLDDLLPSLIYVAVLHLEGRAAAREALAELGAAAGCSQEAGD
jgi:hypothetical protein